MVMFGFVVIKLWQQKWDEYPQSALIRSSPLPYVRCRFSSVYINICFNMDECVCVCVCVCPSQTIKVIIVKLGTMTASDMRMHLALIILTLTFIQGHTCK